jgi:hypothetical protein
MGGIGKTQLAVEFCYRYGRCLKGVHWVQAAKEQDIAAEIAECGAHMRLLPWSDAQQDQVQITLDAWCRSPERLVVLDNLEDPRLLRVWLPQLGGVRLLITSRRHNWPPDLGLAVCPLGTLDRLESMVLLRRLAPRLKKAVDDEINGLAERLGDLPLALDLAGRYLEERNELGVEDYLKKLALDHTSLRDWSSDSPTGHITSLEATFRLSWERLLEGAAYGPARRIFCAAAYCAPNVAIPLLLIEICG